MHLDLLLEGYQLLLRDLFLRSGISTVVDLDTEVGIGAEDGVAIDVRLVVLRGPFVHSDCQNGRFIFVDVDAGEV